MQKIFLPFIFIGFVLIVFAGLYLYAGPLECLAGGDSVTVHAPVAEPGQPVKFELVLGTSTPPQCRSVPLAQYYSNVKCHYRLKGESTFQDLPMVAATEEENWIIYQCHAPRPAASAEIEYYFSYKTDTDYQTDPASLSIQ